MSKRDPKEAVDAIVEKVMAIGEEDPGAGMEAMALVLQTTLGYVPMELRVLLGLMYVGIGGKQALPAIQVLVAFGAKTGKITREQVLEAFDGSGQWLQDFAKRELAESRERRKATADSSSEAFLKNIPSSGTIN